MAWSDVKIRIKFYGPDADDLGNATGLDGMPPTVNGIEPYGLAFSTSVEDGATVPTEKADILTAPADDFADAGDGYALHRGCLCRHCARCNFDLGREASPRLEPRDAGLAAASLTTC